MTVEPVYTVVPSSLLEHIMSEMQLQSNTKSIVTNILINKIIIRKYLYKKNHHSWCNKLHTLYSLISTEIEAMTTNTQYFIIVQAS